MWVPDPVGLRARELLRDRLPELVAEVCAWTVGLSDQPHLQRRHGRVVASGVTLGDRANAGLPLSREQADRLELADAAVGSLQDALNALAVDGGLHLDRLVREVLAPFALDTCLAALDRTREGDPDTWSEIVGDLASGPVEESLEDADGVGSFPGTSGWKDAAVDLTELVRSAEWEVPLLADAELLVISGLGRASLHEVEAEGLPLSLVRAAEAELRRAVEDAAEVQHRSDELAGAVFLAEIALRQGGFELPVPPSESQHMLDALLAEGLVDEEVLAVLPHLAVEEATTGTVAFLLASGLGRGGGAETG